MAIPENTILRFKRGHEADLYAVNPILADGEPCWCTDEKILKVGDGKTPYKDLPILFRAETEPVEMPDWYTEAKYGAAYKQLSEEEQIYLPTLNEVYWSEYSCDGKYLTVQAVPAASTLTDINVWNNDNQLHREWCGKTFVIENSEVGHLFCRVSFITDKYDAGEIFVPETLMALKALNAMIPTLPLNMYVERNGVREYLRVTGIDFLNVQQGQSVISLGHTARLQIATPNTLTFAPQAGDKIFYFDPEDYIYKGKAKLIKAAAGKIINPTEETA